MVAVTHKHRDQIRKTHFERFRVKNWRGFTFTALHASYISGASLFDNIIQVSGKLSILFCFLHYEDISAFSKWMVPPKITFWNGKVSYIGGRIACPLCYSAFLHPRLTAFSEDIMNLWNTCFQGQKYKLWPCSYEGNRQEVRWGKCLQHINSLCFC